MQQATYEGSCYQVSHRIQINGFCHTTRKQSNINLFQLTDTPITNKGPEKSKSILKNGDTSLTLKYKVFTESLLYNLSNSRYQNLALSSASVPLTPLWYTLSWQLSITRAVNLWSFGKITGSLTSTSNSEFPNLPLHFKIPSQLTMPNSNH